eukprot:scaffold10626_cov53-Attheya_sp.AAC.2
MKSAVCQSTTRNISNGNQSSCCHDVDTPDDPRTRHSTYPDPFSSSLLKDKPTTHPKCEPCKKRSTTENSVPSCGLCFVRLS